MWKCVYFQCLNCAQPIILDEKKYSKLTATYVLNTCPQYKNYYSPLQPWMSNAKTMFTSTGLSYIQLIIPKTMHQQHMILPASKKEFTLFLQLKYLRTIRISNLIQDITYPFPCETIQMPEEQGIRDCSLLWKLNRPCLNQSNNSATSQHLRKVINQQLKVIVMER